MAPIVPALIACSVTMSAARPLPALVPIAPTSTKPVAVAPAAARMRLADGPFFRAGGRSVVVVVTFPVVTIIPVVFVFLF